MPAESLLRALQELLLDSKRTRLCTLQRLKAKVQVCQQLGETVIILQAETIRQQRQWQAPETGSTGFVPAARLCKARARSLWQ